MGNVVAVVLSGNGRAEGVEVILRPRWLTAPAHIQKTVTNRPLTILTTKNTENRDYGAVCRWGINPANFFSAASSIWKSSK